MTETKKNHHIIRGATEGGNAFLMCVCGLGTVRLAGSSEEAWTKNVARFEREHASTVAPADEKKEE